MDVRSSRHSRSSAKLSTTHRGMSEKSRSRTRAVHSLANQCASGLNDVLVTKTPTPNGRPAMAPAKSRTELAVLASDSDCSIALDDVEVVLLSEMVERQVPGKTHVQRDVFLQIVVNDDPRFRDVR